MRIAKISSDISGDDETQIAWSFEHKIGIDPNGCSTLISIFGIDKSSIIIAKAISHEFIHLAIRESLSWGELKKNDDYDEEKFISNTGFGYDWFKEGLPDRYVPVYGKEGTLIYIFEIMKIGGVEI